MSRTRFIRFRHVPQFETLEARDVPSFLQPVHYAVNGETRAVAAADFNRDMCLDVAVTVNHPPNHRVGIFLGDCIGGLGEPSYYAAGASSLALATTDLNRDGKPDLIAGSNGVDVLLGNGDGSFQTVKSYSTGNQGVSDIAVGDLNGDDIPDVATSSNSLHQDSMSTLLGVGDGSFQPFEIQWIGNGGSNGVAIGDLDRDGLDDATVDAHWGHELHVFYGNGSHHIFEITSPWGHALADLNRDGDLDLVAGSPTREKIYVMSNRGDGVLQPETSFATPNTTMYAVVADISHDGKRDIVTRDGIYLLGNGDATFQKYGTYDTGAELERMTTGDLNQDGFADLVAGGSGGVTVILNNKRWRNPAPIAGSIPSSLSIILPSLRPNHENAEATRPRHVGNRTAEALLTSEIRHVNNVRSKFDRMSFCIRQTLPERAIDFTVPIATPESLRTNQNSDGVAPCEQRGGLTRSALRYR
jgi:hypothetical protein